MNPKYLLTLGNFFSSLHYFLVIYISAPYLATLMPAEYVGWVFSLSAVLSIVLFFAMPYLVRQFGPRKLGIFLAVFTMATLLGLATMPGAAVAIVLIALSGAASLLIPYQLDLLLEAVTDSAKTAGSTRTLFINGANIALIGSPLVMGFLVGDDQGYARVFFVAALTLIPFIALLLLKKFPEGEHSYLHQLRAAAVCLARDRDLRAVMSANFLLHFFFTLAPIYIPLYLHTILGIPWTELGWILSVMLIPFLLLEYPAGWLADNKWGDRELMAFGFTIMGISFAAIAFIGVATSIPIIVFILVFTRIGAALVEAMTEGHFFRRITAKDSSSVAVFRITRPLGGLIAPLFGTALLLWSSYNMFFLVAGIFLVIGGVTAAFFIRDLD